MLLPEFPEPLDQVFAWVTSVRDRGRSSLVVVAEGFRLDGTAAADAALAGSWGTLATLQGDRIEMVPLAEVTGRLKLVPEDRYAAARLNFG